MTPEAALLLACVRKIARPEAAHDIRAGSIDWPCLISLAEEHAVLPQLYWVLGSACPERVRQSFEATARCNLTLTRELLRVLDLFESHRIQALPLKGPLLAQSLYGNLALRSFSDLDFLAAPADVPRIADLLTSNGYRAQSTLHWPSKTAWRRVKECEMSFASTEGVSLDLHRALLPSYLAVSVETDRLWSDRQTVPLGGRSVPTLSSEHLLWFLCCHGGKHMWERLGWICDVARLIEVSPNLDWGRVLSDGEATDTSDFLLLGLRLASSLLGAALPPGIPNRTTVDEAVGAVTARLFTGPHPPTARDSLRFTLPLLKTAVQKMRYTAGLILTPTEAEFRLLQLPPWLYPIYYPYRAARLIGKHLF